jgi:hypothetical protein
MQSSGGDQRQRHAPAGSTNAPASSSGEAKPPARRRCPGTRLAEEGRTVSLEDFDVSRKGSHYPYETRLW